MVAIASAAQMRSIVIGWWATYPAEKIDGVMIPERALKIREDDVNQIFGANLRPPAAAAPTSQIASSSDGRLREELRVLGYVE